MNTILNILRDACLYGFIFYIAFLLLDIIEGLAWRDKTGASYLTALIAWFILALIT